ncbi:MAG: 4'-phosphopantetheinyl transferase superfamily protein [Verrucomicrobiota bacterium]
MTTLTLDRDDVRLGAVVWIALLSEVRDAVPTLEPLLDVRERDRAARFRFDDDRARFTLGRGLARRALGAWLDRAPEAVELALTATGRPVVAGEPALHFSISHTRDVVALALAHGARVGIDFEMVAPSIDLPALAGRVLSGEELLRFRGLDRHEAVTAFYRAWTRKEAYLKALGEGIAEGLARVSVGFEPVQIAGLIDTRDLEASRPWRLHELALVKGYLGALACEDPARRPRCTAVGWRDGRIVTKM